VEPYAISDGQYAGNTQETEVEVGTGLNHIVATSKHFAVDDYGYITTTVGDGFWKKYGQIAKFLYFFEEASQAISFYDNTNALIELDTLNPYMILPQETLRWSGDDGIITDGLFDDDGLFKTDEVTRVRQVWVPSEFTHNEKGDYILLKHDDWSYGPSSNSDRPAIPDSAFASISVDTTWRVMGRNYFFHELPLKIGGHLSSHSVTLGDLTVSNDYGQQITYVCKGLDSGNLLTETLYQFWDDNGNLLTEVILPDNSANPVSVEVPEGKTVDYELRGACGQPAHDMIQKDYQQNYVDLNDKIADENDLFTFNRDTYNSADIADSDVNSTGTPINLTHSRANYDFRNFIDPMNYYSGVTSTILKRENYFKGADGGVIKGTFSAGSTSQSLELNIGKVGGGKPALVESVLLRKATTGTAPTITEASAYQSSLGGGATKLGSDITAGGGGGAAHTSCFTSVTNAFDKTNYGGTDDKNFMSKNMVLFSGSDGLDSSSFPEIHYYALAMYGNDGQVPVASSGGSVNLNWDHATRRIGKIAIVESATSGITTLSATCEGIVHGESSGSADDTDDKEPELRQGIVFALNNNVALIGKDPTFDTDTDPVIRDINYIPGSSSPKTIGANRTAWYDFDDIITTHLGTTTTSFTTNTLVAPTEQNDIFMIGGTGGEGHDGYGLHGMCNPAGPGRSGAGSMPQDHQVSTSDLTTYFDGYGQSTTTTVYQTETTVEGVVTDDVYEDSSGDLLTESEIDADSIIYFKKEVYTTKIGEVIGTYTTTPTDYETTAGGTIQLKEQVITDEGIDTSADVTLISENDITATSYYTAYQPTHGAAVIRIFDTPSSSV
jgi:hypothetical protein